MEGRKGEVELRVRGCGRRIEQGYGEVSGRMGRKGRVQDKLIVTRSNATLWTN